MEWEEEPGRTAFSMSQMSWMDKYLVRIGSSSGVVANVEYDHLVTCSMLQFTCLPPRIWDLELVAYASPGSDRILHNSHSWARGARYR